MPILLDHDDGSPFQSFRALGQNDGQAIDDVHGAGVVEAKNHHAHGASARKRRDFAEVEIEGEDDSIPGNRLREDFSVR
jgi:hypothetical protein